MKILLLEDDRLFNETLKEFLEDEGFFVDSVFDPYSAFDLSYEKNYDLYLFDINLPFEDGIKTLKSLRDAKDNTPTIFITSRDDKESLLNGFSVGADDYIKKPIDLDELIARIEVIKRRFSKSNIIKVGDLILDRDRKSVTLKGVEQKITFKEFLLLELLLEKIESVVTYDEIYHKIWGLDEPNGRALRVYISNLKKILPNEIESIRGIGYRFRVDEL